MLRISIAYRRRQAAKALAFTSDELYTRLLQELDKAKIFVTPESAAAAKSSSSAATAVPAKEASTSPPANTATTDTSSSSKK
ncbi:hypothetical protein PINS_up007914 [Pythium insidiosum]|nr:hypothetical protein PINS_up007914 [Pythium insidiosum]